MERLKTTLRCMLVPAVMLMAISVKGQASLPAPQYHIYAGNTHSHTIFSVSHGAQYTYKVILTRRY